LSVLDNRKSRATACTTAFDQPFGGVEALERAALAASRHTFAVVGYRIWPLCPSCGRAIFNQRPIKSPLRQAARGAQLSGGTRTIAAPTPETSGISTGND
jgi:hypothetical protein